MMMPILVEITYEDGTVEISSSSNLEKNNELKVYILLRETIKKIQIDPKLETADIDVTNNTWPKERIESKFD
jgi:hypothetical protein